MNYRLNLKRSFLLSFISLISLNALANTGAGYKEIPPGLIGKDEADFNHLSEGADIYPYEWLRALKSATYAGNKDVGPMFLDDLHKKFGVLSSSRNKTVDAQGNVKEYLMPMVGISSSWSDHDLRKSDVFIEDSNDPQTKTAFSSDEQKIRVLYQDVNKDGRSVKSIRMVGTNCAICHTNDMQYTVNGQQNIFRIDGAPNVLDIRGYFKDMMASTVATLANEQKMKEFLDRLGVPDSQKHAKELTDEFTENFGIATASILPKWFVQNLSGVQILSTFYTLGKAKIGTKLNAVLDASPIGRFERRQNSDARIFSPTERLYKGADALAKSLESLLRVTYGFGPNDDIGELKYRMKYLGNMMVGNNPMIKETIAGFGRTDAFGRIGNLVLRGNNPVNLTGEVSYPWLWGIKYRSMIHYNGNTNSVVLRNVGQSLGLGAVIFPDGSASSNVYNLDRLEHLVHKIKFPQWEETFKGISELQIKRDLLPRGKEIYTAKCAHCHESDKFVGPVQDGYEHGRLRDLKVSVFKTDLSDSDYVRKNGFDQRDFDPTVAMNATEPVIVNGEKVPFERMILAGVAGIKEKFYQKYQFTQEQKDSFEFRDIRGYEFFRDTKNGFERQNEFGNNYGNIRKNSGYIAKPLAGIWATAPFLHNGSVPTLMDLLKPVEQRPKFFNVKIREFDPVNIGYKGAHRDSPCRSDEEATCFDVSKVGNANTGHAGKIYGTENDITDEDRKALIEYLKVLPPYIEYSWKYNSSEEAGGNW